MSATALIPLLYYTLLRPKMQRFFDFFVPTLKLFDALLEIKALLNIPKTIGSTHIGIIKLLVSMLFRLLKLLMYKSLYALEFFINAFELLIEILFCQ